MFLQILINSQHMLLNPKNPNNTPKIMWNKRRAFMQYYKYKANCFPSSLKMGCACVNILCAQCVHSVYIACT